MTSTQEFNCVFCKEGFKNKEELQTHFRKHGDPNFNQSPKTKTRPSSETQTFNEKKNEETEMVSCDVCTEVFPTISKAITHKHKVHPDHDAKYFCPWCGKLFTMKHLYNKHLQLSHDNPEKSGDIHFHCDPCVVDFYIPSAMLYHNKFFHRQDTDLPSIGQSKKLKMVLQEALQIYYCAFCGEEYDNKVNLHKHMIDDHGDENQSPEDVLRCPLCEALFYHLDAYELHLTFHTTDDLFSETNEMFEQITEFSLETVPPIMEKVENFGPSEDAEVAMNAVGLEKFLEMVMDTPVDNGNDNPKKSKKHKKHKKSKKSAITLDEFLNMNKDVFGEGIDVQGVEEVPTQVVAKRLKAKKFDKPHSGGRKMIGDSNIEKLKKQGIVVKMKPTKKAPNQTIRVGNKIFSKQVTKQSIPTKLTQLKSSDEVLSKLLNQGNSQIKIIKKQPVENDEREEQLEQKGNSESNFEGASDQTTFSENIEVECDVIQSGYTSSEADAKEAGAEKDKHCFQEGQKSVNLKSPKNVVNNLQNTVNDSQDDAMKQKLVENNKPLCNEVVDNVSETNSPNRNIMQTIGNQITMKPISSKSSSKNEFHAKSEDTVIDTQNDSKNDKKIELKSLEPTNSTISYNALKHLSHLITVKPVTSKESPNVTSNIDSYNDDENPEFTEPDNNSDMDESFHESKTVNKVDSSRMQQVSEKKDTSLKSLDPFKNLSKNITIKSLMHSPKSNVDKNSINDYENDSHTPFINQGDKNITGHHNSPMATVNTLDTNAHSPKELPNHLNTSGVKQVNQLIKKEPDILEKVEGNSNISILKHLTNITAKQLTTANSNQQNSIHRSTSNIQKVIKKNFTQTNKEESTNEIEIFNIDDSDSDETEKNIAPASQISHIKPVSNDNTSVEKLKNISKNITVKQINQPSNHTVKNFVKRTQKSEESFCSKNQEYMSDFSDDEDDYKTLIPKTVNLNGQKLQTQNKNIENALKNLGKNITVKSRNSSPNAFIRSKDSNYSQESKDNINDTADSDNDSDPGKVKITELKEDNISEDDMTEETFNKKSSYDINFHSPLSNSDFDDNINDDTDGELSDLESQIQANTLKKPYQNTSNQTLEFMNLNKNITIKSLNKGQVVTDNACKKSLPSVSNSEVSIKNLKPIKNNGAETSINKNISSATVSRPVNQSVKHNLASNSQHSTVNKEVTVKTFQTKTVIQEITTTVTKTIKTVNQTVKQEVQSTSQAAQPMKYQKIQGMKSCQQAKNFQGVMVRHSAPTAGTKIRGSTPIRPSVGTAVRPVSNQLVPVRSMFNPVRTNSPRMPTIRKAVPSTSHNPQGPMQGKPLKVSAKVLNTTTKRPTDDKVGHFSCFKKPKESLFPTSEMNLNEDPSSESTVHYASQMSRSNFTSATKTVKGNTVVTQMKSEISTSSQQLSKLNNLSGLKIMKTSQSKQAVQVEEKSEVSASKRNTLEAIEKLQKQGLLVKKPRLDASDENYQSDEDDHYLTEEPDD